MRQIIGILVLVLLAACSPSTPAPTTIGSSGGTVNSSDGKTSLEVPAGAYSTNTTLSIAASSNPPSAPSAKAIVPGSAITITGTDPSKPITLKLKYDPAQVSGLGVRGQAAASSLVIFHLVNNIWTAVQSNVDQTAQIVSALISQLGTYVLLADATPTGGTLSSIEIVTTKTSIPVGGTTLFLAYSKDASGKVLDPQPQVTWVSSDPSKATINALSGLATGVAVGSTNITASVGGVTSNTIALTVTAGGGGTTGSFTATAIPKPSSLLSAFPLAFNNNGAVALAGLSSSLTTIDSIQVYNGTSSSPVSLPSGISIALNGITAKACINDGGQVAFSAIKAGKNQPMFYNGSSSVEMNFGLADPSSMLIKDCNNSGAVLGDTLSGGGGRIWQDGATTTLSGIGFGNLALGISSTNTVSLGFGYFKGGKYTTYSDSSFIGNKLNDSERVLGFKFVGGVRQLFVYDIATNAISPLASPVSADASLIDFNNKGQALLGYKNQTWLVDASKVSEVVVSGINQGSAVALNDNGWILIRDSNGTNAGYILKSQ